VGGLFGGGGVGGGWGGDGSVRDGSGGDGSGGDGSRVVIGWAVMVGRAAKGWWRKVGR
jgi:hypothetical protein